MSAGLEALSANQEADICALQASLPASSPEAAQRQQLMAARGEANRIAQMLTTARFALCHAAAAEAKEVAKGFIVRPGRGLVFEAVRRIERLERELAGAEAREQQIVDAMSRRHAA
jgi:hypothetical protein